MVSMMPQMPPVGAMVFLLEWAAADCIRVAENCHLPRTARFLRLLAADVTLERDKCYRLLMEQQPTWDSQRKLCFVSVPAETASSSPAERPRRPHLVGRAMERLRVVAGSDTFSTVTRRLAVRS